MTSAQRGICGLYGACSPVPLAFALFALLALPANLAAQEKWQFEDVSGQIGVSFQYEVDTGQIDVRDFFGGGLAAADINGNGLVDLYVPQGNTSPGRLLENQGDGQFIDVSGDWNLVVETGANPEAYATGAAFADLTGNGYPDLVLTGIRAFGTRLYLNDGSQFTEATIPWGLALNLQDSWSVSFADIDGSGRLDMAATYWNELSASHEGYLWLNQGDELTDISYEWQVSEAFSNQDYSFTPNFADLTGNGRPDLLVAADFDTSQYFHNVDGQKYQLMTDEVIDDENGMGAAVGDFNNNGHLDWFVTSIYQEDESGRFTVGSSGNRLYENDGQGVLADATESAGVRDGAWGWGTCAADFNNSGYLDLFMVNGWNAPDIDFPESPSRMFVNQGDGSFHERAVELGLDDWSSGRGIVCFDYDRDGDIDIFVQNNQDSGRVFRNNASDLNNHWLGVRLEGQGENTAAVGARVVLETPSGTQVREMAIPNHYLSTSPPEVHFGLGPDPTIESLTVHWPGGGVTEHREIEPNQWKSIEQPEDGLFSDRFEGGS